MSRDEWIIMEMAGWRAGGPVSRDQAPFELNEFQVIKQFNKVAPSWGCVCVCVLVCVC